ncbi:MAG: ATP-binding protein [Rhizomicrobium sp.]
MHSRLRHSIGTKIFVAFVAMGVIVGALGAYGYWVLESAGEMVTNTYDGPLMAINYARAASVDFVQMQQAVLRRKIAAHSERPAFDKKIDTLTSLFFDDLDIARERSTANDERAIVEHIQALVESWQTKWRISERMGDDPDLEALDRQIMDGFDMLVELNADHSFVGRRKAVWAISYYKFVLGGATFAALLFGLIITLFLARRIVRPLSEAASVADRIALGEFETPIPPAGEDETGILLNSMTVMQDNIRAMVAREKQRAESAESRLAEALDTSGEGVLLVDKNGRVLVANGIMRNFFPSASGMFVTGADFGEIARVARLDIRGEALFPSSQQLRLGEGSRALGCVERQLRDGRWIRSTGSRTGDGGLIFFIGDYTAMKEREENSRRAQTAAEAASAAKSRFLANMSHELRTPLNAIIGFSEMLTGQIFGALGNDRYLGYATDIQNSGRHLLDIINSVLEISKSEAGSQSFKSEFVDVRFVLMECEKALRSQCDAASIAFRLDEGTLPAVVLGEKTKLRQAFTNLLSNAIKFTEAGGTVDVFVAAGEKDVIVSVVDSGIGMTPDDIEVALTPFGQVDSRLERKYGGTGLGLPLAKSIVEIHGGRLDIESEYCRGTTVRMHFPNAGANDLKQLDVAS